MNRGKSPSVEFAQVRTTKSPRFRTVWAPAIQRGIGTQSAIIVAPRHCLGLGFGCGRGRRSADFLSIVQYAWLDAFPPHCDAMAVGVTQRISAAAVLLLVEILALADLDHACRTAALSPVVVPVQQARIAFGGSLPAVVDLLHVLPPRDAERAGNDRKVVFVRVQRRALKAHVEAHGATDASLRFVFHALGARKPIVAVVVRVDKGHAKLFRKADILVLAQFVFLQWMDVRVIEENGEVDARGVHGFHHFAAARRATGMQQHFGVTIEQGQRISLEVWFVVHVVHLG